MQNSAESQFFKELIDRYLPPAPAIPDPEKVTISTIFIDD